MLSRFASAESLNDVRKRGAENQPSRSWRFVPTVLPLKSPGHHVHRLPEIRADGGKSECGVGCRQDALFARRFLIDFIGNSRFANDSGDVSHPHRRKRLGAELGKSPTAQGLSKSGFQSQTATFCTPSSIGKGEQRPVTHCYTMPYRFR